MKLVYEKHQRDYTVLSTSIVMEEVFTNRFKKFFPMKSYPTYILVKKGFLYHFFSERDYKSWPNSWLKKYNISDLIKYKQKIDKILIEYKKFLKQKHNNLESDIEKTNQSIRDFLPIIMISTYVPMYGKTISKKLLNLCLKTRKQYEDAHKTAMSLQVKLLRKLEKQLKLKKDILVYLTIQEFRNFLLNKKLPKNIEKRKNFVLIEHSFNGEKVFNKINAVAKLKLIDPDILTKSLKEFKGSVAYQGVVKGKVKKVRLVKEADKLKKGDILVTSMTDPRYVPAMKRAGAIVTDEGGITCHAAIVARELKKPCIIGTKIATKVLKDGDKVEVDANKGVVKIIK